MKVRVVFRYRHNPVTGLHDLQIEFHKGDPNWQGKITDVTCVSHSYETYDEVGQVAKCLAEFIGIDDFPSTDEIFSHKHETIVFYDSDWRRVKGKST